MSSSNLNALQDVVDLLERRGGFRTRPKPLHVADIDYDFEFDAVLEGPMEARTLILVLVKGATPGAAIERRLRSFSVALRRTGSMRPLTLVLLLESPDPPLVNSLQPLCRILPLLPGEA